MKVQPLSKQDEVTFRSFGLHDSLQASIDAAGFERPLPIQAEFIPPALEGRDVIGLAQTGTGKTAAFAIPIIQRLPGRLELAALVLAPTRELAAQITAVFEQLGAASGIRVAAIVGGVPMDDDHAALRMLLLDVRQEFQTAHAGHGNIRNDDRNVVLAQDLFRRLRIARSDARKTSFFQTLAD